jgi:hypothetical protein
MSHIFPRSTHYTQFHDPKLNGASDDSTSEVCTDAMFVLLMTGIRRYEDRLASRGMMFIPIL